jgi:hypothetical protein
VLAIVCPVNAAIKVSLSILYKSKIVNFCDSHEPLVVLILVQSNEAFVTKIFDAGQEVFFFGGWVHQYAGD